MPPSVTRPRRSVAAPAATRPSLLQQATGYAMYGSSRAGELAQSLRQARLGVGGQQSLDMIPQGLPFSGRNVPLGRSPAAMPNVDVQQAYNAGVPQAYGSSRLRAGPGMRANSQQPLTANTYIGPPTPHLTNDELTAVMSRIPPASVQSDSFYEPLSASRNALHQRNMQAYNQMGQMSRGATRIGEIAATVGQGGAAPDLFPNMTPSQRQMLQAYRMDAPPVAVPEGYAYQNGQYTPQYDPMRRPNQRPVPGQMYGGSAVLRAPNGRNMLVGGDLYNQMAGDSGAIQSGTQLTPTGVESLRFAQQAGVAGETRPNNQALYQRDQDVMAERRLRRAEARFGPGAGSETDRMRMRQQQPAAQPVTVAAPQGAQPIEPISFSEPAVARAAEARYDELVANPSVDALFTPLSTDPNNPMKYGNAPPEAFMRLFLDTEDSESYQTLQELFRHKVAFDPTFLKEIDPRTLDQLEQLSRMPLTVTNRRSRRGRTTR